MSAPWYVEAFRGDYRDVYAHRNLAAAREEVSMAGGVEAAARAAEATGEAAKEAAARVVEATEEVGSVVVWRWRWRWRSTTWWDICAFFLVNT